MFDQVPEYHTRFELFTTMGSIMSNISRRRFLYSSLAGGASLAAGGSILHARDVLAQSSGTIRVTHFGGPYQAIDSLVGKKFMEQGKGKVVYDQDQPALVLSKWLAQPDNPPYDIGMMGRAFTIRAFNGGVVTPLTTQDVPRLAQAVPGALAPSNAGVAMGIDSLDIMYDRRAVTTPITSWLDLWRPDFKDKIVLPAMPLGVAITYLLASVARAMGGDETKIDDAIAKFKELKRNVRSFYGDPNLASQQIERGEIVVAPQYSARIGQLMKRSDRVARATPKEGVPAIPYDLVIAKGSRYQALAKNYINFVLSPEIQAGISSQILLTPAVNDVKLDKDVQKLIVSDVSKLFTPNESFILTKQAGWLERWQREIQA